MKAVIFARVSTQEQEQDGHSIKAQLAKLREYSSRNNLDVVREYEVVESSTRGERPEFYKMIEFVQAQQGQIALVCDKVDRLQRSFTELPVLDKLRKQNKLVLHFLDIGKLDVDANSQQISFYQMSVVMANAYTNAISDNVKRTVLHKLNNGECIRKAPIGYLNERDEYGKSNVIVDKARSLLIQEMFKMYATGNYSLGDLAKFAEHNGFTNNFYKHGKAKTLSKNTISTMLKEPFYYGEQYVKKYNRFFPHKYEPLISKALYDECQRVTQIRSQANNRIQAIQNSKKEFIFRSLVKCAVTGRTVSSDRKEAKTNKNTYLITWNPKDTKKKLYIPEQDILKQVAKVFKALAIPEKTLEEATKRLQQSHEDEQVYHAHRIEQLRKEEDIIRNKINRLLDIYLEKGISEAVFNVKNEALEQELKSNRIERQMHEDADNNFKNTLITAFRLASRAGHLFESSKTSEKRELINFVFSNLTLRGKKLEYALRKPFDVLVKLSKCETWLPVLHRMRKECHEEMLDLATHVQVIRRNFGLAA